MDLSHFPLNHPFYSDKCKGELGKLKIEIGPYLIKEFVGLKSKAYLYTTMQSVHTSHSTLKGVPKHIRNNIDIKTYKECL